MHIGIAGAGIMGRLLAWRLADKGCRVELFERDPLERGTGASCTAAGMLAPFCELESAEFLVYRMGMEGLGLWRALAGELGDIGYRDRGSLVLAHEQDRADLQRFRQLLEDKLGQSPSPLFQHVEGKALAALEPALAGRFHSGLLLPGEACVDNLKVLAALAAQLDKSGVACHAETPVEQVLPRHLRIGGRDRTFDWAIDCRGLGARAEFEGLRGVRGELLQVSAPAVKIRRMLRLMHPRYRLYLVPGAEDRYLLGATQIESEDYSPISVRSALELLSALYCLHEGFAEARIIGSRSNCRPALPDNLPRVTWRPGLIQVNGLFRHGYLLAPVLMEQISNMLLQGASCKPEYSEIFSVADDQAQGFPS